MSAALRQRAEIALLQMIQAERSRRSAPNRPPWQGPRTSYFDPDEAGRRERLSFQFSAEVLAAIEAISRAELRNWIDRFESEGKPTEPPREVAPDPETERRARKLLRERLPARYLDPETEAYKQAIWRFQTAQAVVNIAGALSKEERAHWQERLLDHVSGEDRRKLHRPPLCRGVELERVIPGTTDRHDGVRITHVELYSDGLIVHWHHAAEFEPGVEQTSWARFQATKPDQSLMKLDLDDDVGTSYRWWPGPSHDAVFRKDGFVHWMSATFTPAVPETATRLRASRGPNDFEITLDS